MFRPNGTENFSLAQFSERIDAVLSGAEKLCSEAITKPDMSAVSTKPDNAADGSEKKTAPTANTGFKINLSHAIEARDQENLLPELHMRLSIALAKLKYFIREIKNLPREVVDSNEPLVMYGKKLAEVEAAVANRIKYLDEIMPPKTPNTPTSASSACTADTSTPKSAASTHTRDDDAPITPPKNSKISSILAAYRGVPKKSPRDLYRSSSPVSPRSPRSSSPTPALSPGRSSASNSPRGNMRADNKCADGYLEKMTFIIAEAETVRLPALMRSTHKCESTLRDVFNTTKTRNIAFSGQTADGKFAIACDQGDREKQEDRGSFFTNPNFALLDETHRTAALEAWINAIEKASEDTYIPMLKRMSAHLYQHALAYYTLTHLATQEAAEVSKLPTAPIFTKGKHTNAERAEQTRDYINDLANHALTYLSSHNKSPNKSPNTAPPTPPEFIEGEVTNAEVITKTWDFIYSLQEYLFNPYITEQLQYAKQLFELVANIWQLIPDSQLQEKPSYFIKTERTPLEQRFDRLEAKARAMYENMTPNPNIHHFDDFVLTTLSNKKITFEAFFGKSEIAPDERMAELDSLIQLFESYDREKKLTPPKMHYISALALKLVRDTYLPMGNDGGVLCAAISVGDRVYTVNVGDSFASMLVRNKAFDDYQHLTTAHEPWSDEERARLIKAGKWRYLNSDTVYNSPLLSSDCLPLKFGRIYGLSPSHTIGDLSRVYGGHYPKHRASGITHKPTITSTSLVLPSDDTIVNILVATDGTNRTGLLPESEDQVRREPLPKSVELPSGPISHQSILAGNDLDESAQMIAAKFVARTMALGEWADSSEGDKDNATAFVLKLKREDLLTPNPLARGILVVDGHGGYKCAELTISLAATLFNQAVDAQLKLQAQQRKEKRQAQKLAPGSTATSFTLFTPLKTPAKTTNDVIANPVRKKGARRNSFG